MLTFTKRFLMKHTILLAIIALFISTKTFAQQNIGKGILMELVSSEKIKNAQVKNLRTNAETSPDNNGAFQLEAQLNDLWEIKAPGYETDTVFIYDNSLRRIYLQRSNDNIQLTEVIIERMTDSRLAAEIGKMKRTGKFVDAGQNRGGVRVSPSRLFGKEGKVARSNYDVLIAEQEKRAIDRVFTDALIQSITPFEGEKLSQFKEQFRPSYK